MKKLTAALLLPFAFLFLLTACGNPMFVKIEPIDKGQYIEGGIVTLGQFDDMPIEWLVLKVQSDEALLITKNNLCKRVFDVNGSSLWENSSIRDWLNGEFLLQSFAPGIQARMLVGTSEGDKVFLLSREEAEIFFEDDADRANGDYWWLRTASKILSEFRNNPLTVQAVSDAGKIPHESVGGAASGLFGVRPAMWISLA